VIVLGIGAAEGGVSIAILAQDSGGGMRWLPHFPQLRQIRLTSSFAACAGVKKGQFFYFGGVRAF
jgi:hypothetical protein